MMTLKNELMPKLEHSVVKSFEELHIETIAPNGVISYKFEGNNKLIVSIDTTTVPDDNAQNFKLVLSPATNMVQFPSKMHWKLKILSNETGRKPRLSIRMFRKGEDVKYRKFICDLDYQSADNDIIMNNIESSTASIVVRFKHELTTNMKFTFSIENMN